MTDPLASCTSRPAAVRERGRRLRGAIGLCGLALSVGPPAGCAPARFIDGVHFAARRFNVSSASSSTVKGKAYLRFDADLRADLDEMLQDAGDPSACRQADDLLRAANELANREVSGELDRMPDRGIEWLSARYGAGAATSATAVREGLKTRFRAEGARELEAELSRLSTEEQARQRLVETRRRLRAVPGDRGRVTRAVLAAPFFIPAVIGAEIADAEATQRSLVADFDEAVDYRPLSASLSESPDDLASLGLQELAARYAPIFVQQIRSDAAHGESEDQIGAVRLAGTADDIQVVVDTTRPTVYWTHSRARIRKRRYDQLVYVAWYSSRPAMFGGDVQAGKIDGVVIRVTLDRHRRPAIYEFVRSCGCYHTLWVAEFVEAAARAEFGAPNGDRRFAVQTMGKNRLFVPALVRDDGGNPRRPEVFVEAGYHTVPAIRPRDPGFQGAAGDARTYALEPYDSLTRLPLAEGVASMFDNNGLVHDAARMEGLLLAPTGMLSAGQPRQLGTMKVRMDAYDYDDPRLLERSLRLPSSF